MSGPIRLYVSSSPDLQPEREAVGQVVARLPLTLGWQIGHTPMAGDPAVGNLFRAAESDIYMLVLGHDFAAPMGAELQQALSLHRVPLAYRKRCTQSPSSQDVVRRLEVAWRSFSTVEVLAGLLQRDLLQTLLSRATEFGLDIGELEALLKSAQAEAERLEVTQGVQQGRGEAGRSSVILGREVWEEKPS